MINPFVPPGHDDCVGNPLDPWDHESWYLDVAGFGSALGRFRTKLAEATSLLGRPGTDLDALKRRGRLVVVQGPARSGKTTLIRRCMRELTEQSGQPDTEVVVYNVDARMTPPPGTTIRALTEEVRDTVLARAAQFFPAAEYAELKAAADSMSPGNAYIVLSQSLGPHRLVQLHTPAVEHDMSAEHVSTYEQWAAPGLVVFAQHITTDDSEPLVVRQSREGSEPMLVLQLRDLEHAEVATIARERTSDGRKDPALPEIDLGDLLRVVDLLRSPPSVGWVVNLCARAFQARIDGGTPWDGLSLMKYDELVHAWAHDPAQGEQP